MLILDSESGPMECTIQMCEHPYGKWVLYDDVEKLLADLEDRHAEELSLMQDRINRLMPANVHGSSVAAVILESKAKE